MTFYCDNIYLTFNATEQQLLQIIFQHVMRVKDSKGNSSKTTLLRAVLIFSTNH